ncbi:MAG TPA: TIGR01459 family HAD-type hydrolase [Usitatibacter sp.]|nr:TIGR01459 family HAD-type hydrolase [Usitatibacter sp.]
MPASPELPGVAALARDYDAFILDQWGILHDGERPYPGAIECLERLRASGKRIVVLSNSGRREEENLRVMAGMGFERRLFDRCISAGEDAREALERRSHPFHAALGRRYYAFTRDDNVSLLEGLPFERVVRVEDADFVIVIGIDSPPKVVADYEGELAAGAARRLPMLCANPDVIRPSPTGVLDAPGALAQRYERLGGEVFYHGKPYPAIYDSCVAALADYHGRIVAVGDAIETDVLGATRAALPCAFVAGGIHADELGIRWGQMPEPRAWQRLLDGAVARPQYLLATFRW